jgi:hypothetical protein
MRGLARVVGEQRWLWKAARQIHDDRQALGQLEPVNLEHRHEPLRIERPILVALLRALGEVHGATLVFDAF